MIIKNAIVSIHPGAEDGESGDWASMPYRMYLRFYEREGFKIEVLDFQEGDEAGLKDVSFIVRGENAYGYLKGRKRYPSSGARKPIWIAQDADIRAFLSVMVSPELNDDIEINVERKIYVLIITAQAARAGSTSIKLKAPWRITHLPTGIVVQCQNDRNQHKNKETAMKVLKSRLYELELMKQREKDENTPKSEIGWGHQIRSYVLFPYQQVKDVRSGIAYSQTDAILDGDLKSVIGRRFDFASEQVNLLKG